MSSQALAPPSSSGRRNGLKRISSQVGKDTSKRGKSMDAIAYQFQSAPMPMKATVAGGARAVSTTEVMNRLQFENLDVLDTPLSSLRSCSEYNKTTYTDNRNSSDDAPKHKSFFGSLFGWSKKDKKHNNKVRFNSREDQVYMIESLRFNEANLREGEESFSRSGRLKSKDSNEGFSSSSTHNKHVISSADNNHHHTHSSSSHHAHFLYPPAPGAGLTHNSNDYDNIHEKKRQFSVSTLHFTHSHHHHSTLSHSHSSPTHRQSHTHNHSPHPLHRHRHTSSRSRSFLNESSVAWDYVFGYGPRNKNLPMEIELKDLKPPQKLNVYTSNELQEDEEGRLSNVHLLREEALGVLGIRRVTSFGAFERIRAESTGSESIRTSLTSHSSAAVFALVALDLYRPATWLPWARDEYLIRSAQFRHFYARHMRTEDHEQFYESIRIQPFSSGSYLRGMLSAGFCSMVFSFYNVVAWPTALPLSPYGRILENTLYAAVCLQMILNFVQLPVRLRINSLCWDSSRVVEVDEAINFIRIMLGSDAWIVNRSFGIVLDSLSVLILVLSEIYLWTSSNSLSPSARDPLRPQLVSLCATSLLTLMIRLLVATLFGLSMHDPEVLSNARRRGLSKWDLDTLPSMVFSSREEVNNHDCCICLGQFELGEMLTCLPCDKNHSFHAGCIRSWLERQNACPLCQRMI